MNEMHTPRRVNPLAPPLLAGCLALAAGWSPAVQAERYALLIGVSDYQVSPLEGPPHDVAALKQALTDRWGFAPGNIVTLVNPAASRDRILRELRGLRERTQAGDHVFIYFSGHGTSARAPGKALPLPHTSGALIPADFPVTGSSEEQLNKLIVGRRDLRPVLEELDRGGRWVFAAFDSCYSGNAVRGLYRSALPGGALTTRYLPLSRGGTGAASGGDDPDLCGYRCGTREQEPYPYRNVFFLAAASDDEQAVDIGELHLGQFPTLDEQPHGAFSDALLRALTGRLNADRNGDGLLTYDELQRALQGFMEERDYPHVPQRLPAVEQDPAGLGTRGVFEQTRAPAAVVTPAAGAASLRVYLAGDEAGLAERLKSLPGVVLVREAPEVTVQRAGRRIDLISGAGDLIGSLENPSDQEVAERIAQEAWIKKLLQAGGKSAFSLTLDLVDSQRGITVVEGEQVAFTVRSERPVYALLLDIDAKGVITVLYPHQERELEPLPAGQPVPLPGGGAIKVTEPFGKDQLVLFGFTRQPPLLRELRGKRLTAGSSLLAELEQLLAREEGQYARSAFKLLSVPRQKPGSAGG